MNKITLKEIIKEFEEIKEITKEDLKTSHSETAMIVIGTYDFVLKKLYLLKKEMENGIRQLQDMAGRSDYWEGSLDTYREILGEEK